MPVQAWYDSQLKAPAWFDDGLDQNSWYDELLQAGAPASAGYAIVFIATNEFNGDMFRCYFKYDVGTSGTGTAYGQYRRYSDSAWSSAFQFKNSGVALSIADGGMSNVRQAFSNQGEWTWTPIIAGGTLPTTWYSNDEGRTWRKQP